MICWIPAPHHVFDKDIAYFMERLDIQSFGGDNVCFIAAKPVTEDENVCRGARLSTETVTTATPPIHHLFISQR